MAISTVSVSTEHASRYLQQLCKHWAHKFEVEFTPQQGRIIFTDGRTATLQATEQTLDIVADAPADTLAQFEDVIASHIIRFAFREELIFNWQQQS